MGTFVPETEQKRVAELIPTHALTRNTRSHYDCLYADAPPSRPFQPLSSAYV